MSSSPAARRLKATTAPIPLGPRRQHPKSARLVSTPTHALMTLVTTDHHAASEDTPAKVKKGKKSASVEADDEEVQVKPEDDGDEDRDLIV